MSKLPALDRRLLQTLSRDEIQRMEDACATERSKLIIRVLADTGIRASELCDLRTLDVVSQGREHYLHIRRGKGGKGRLVPIPRLHLRLRRFVERGNRRMSTATRTTRFSVSTGGQRARVGAMLR